MTAALSVVTYGPAERLVAEFYTAQEWLSLQDRAKQDPCGQPESVQSAIKAARELMEKSKALGGDLKLLLGTTKDDALSELEQYVGANGRYVSITKTVRIEVPREYLRGVEIVDTPGFNDPIVSREERTKSFLTSADAVVLMLYAGRPFDATDRDILTRQVAQAAIGQVIIGINKYDIPYCDRNHPETEAEIVRYVKAEIAAASRASGSQALSDLLSERSPIPLSAEMALVGRMDRSQLEADEDLSFAFKKHCEAFGVATQAELYRLSHQEELVAAIRELIEQKKGELLLGKPLARLRQVCHERRKLALDALQAASDAVANFSLNEEELDAKILALEAANVTVDESLAGFGETLDGIFQDVEERAKSRFDFLTEETVERMRTAVNVSDMKDVDALKQSLNYEKERLCTKQLPELCGKLSERAKVLTLEKLDSFLDDVVNRIDLDAFLQEFDVRGFAEECKKSVRVDIDASLFTFTAESFEPTATEGGGSVLENLLFGVIGIALSPLILLGSIFSSGSDEDLERERKKILSAVDEMREKFDTQPLLDGLHSQREHFLDGVGKVFKSQLLEPLLEQAKQARSDVEHRAERQQAAEAALAEATSTRDRVEATASDIMRDVEEASRA